MESVKDSQDVFGKFGIQVEGGSKVLSTNTGTASNKDALRGVIRTEQTDKSAAPSNPVISGGNIAATSAVIVSPTENTAVVDGAEIVTNLDSTIQNFRGTRGNPEVFLKPNSANHQLSAELAQQDSAQEAIVKDTDTMLASLEALKLKVAAGINRNVSTRIDALSREISTRIDAINTAIDAYKQQEAINVKAFNTNKDLLERNGEKLNVRAEELDKIKARANELGKQGKKAEAQGLSVYVKTEQEILAKDQAAYAKKIEIFEPTYLRLSSQALEPLYKNICDAREDLYNFLEPKQGANGEIISGQVEKLLSDLHEIAKTTPSRVDAEKLKAALNGEEMTDKMASFIAAPATQKYLSLQDKTLEVMTARKDEFLAEIKDANVRQAIGEAFDKKQVIYIGTKRDQRFEDFVKGIKDKEERETAIKAVQEGRAVYVNTNDKRAKAFAELLNTFYKNEVVWAVERGTELADRVEFASRAAHIATGFLARQSYAMEKDKRVTEETLKLVGKATKVGKDYGPDDLERKINQAIEKNSVEMLSSAWTGEWQKVAGTAQKSFWQRFRSGFGLFNISTYDKLVRGAIKGLPYTIALGAISGAFSHHHSSGGDNGGSGGSGSGN